MSEKKITEDLQDKLEDLERNIIEHIHANSQFSRMEGERLVKSLRIDPATIRPQSRPSPISESGSGQPTFRDLAEKLVKESVIEMRDNIKDTFETPQEKRNRERGVRADPPPQTPFNNEEQMTELLSIYALNLIPLITSLSLVPDYKKTILKIIQDINRTISGIEREIRDETIGRFGNQLKTAILFELFQLPSPNSYPVIPNGADPYKSRLYDLLSSNNNLRSALSAPFKVFLLQYKTFLEKLISLYERVEESKAEVKKRIVGGFKKINYAKTRVKKSRKCNKSIKTNKNK